MEKFLRNQLENGIFAGVPVTRSQTMSAIRGKNNRSTEMPIRMGLVRRGISGWKQHPNNVSGRPDFWFDTLKLAIFIDGCFWHGCPSCGHVPKTNSNFWTAKIARNRERDKETDKQLRSLGYHVLRFWEHDVNTRIDRCLNKINQTVAKAR